MRLNPAQVKHIRHIVNTLAGESARVWLFGSRVDDQALGGDVDLMLELDTPVAEPAALSAKVSVQVAKGMYGRKVDVLLKAPNLQLQPIHAMAQSQGILL